MYKKVNVMASENLLIAIEASVKAGYSILDIYNSDMQITIKDDTSPLTNADNEANRIINSYLVKTGIPIISEENKQIDYRIRKEWNYCWVVDPLDGTKEFIKRNGEFTVNIALIENNSPILGVIFVPVTKELYFTNVKERKSYKMIIDTKEFTREGLDKAKLINPSPFNSKIRIVGSRSHMNDETKLYINKVALEKQVEIVSKGSSLKFCLLAEGKADIYPRFAPTMEWDTAAGHAICTAVGLQVIDCDTEKELLYNKENLLNPWFICR